MFIKAFEGMKDHFNEAKLAKFDAHISSLSPVAAGLLTASRLWAACGVDLQTSEMFLEHCVKTGVMEKRYAVRCPVCHLLLEIRDTPTIGPGGYCSACDEAVTDTAIKEAGTYGDPLYRLLDMSHLSVKAE